jgi:Na+/H+ antiporter NhaD/arsenite permease-like protein
MTTSILLVFIIGYIAIATEHKIKINKTASALITGVLVWVIYILHTTDKDSVNYQLVEHLGDTSSILFFLMGAMTIVEVIDAHNGFEIITDKITHTGKRTLIWIVGFLTFFMSSVLDNLTTTIVMVSLLRKLISNHDDRLLFTGIVVIAANAGGAWTAIGDVTTTMLWIGGQISALNIMLKLFLPSIACLIVPLAVISFSMNGNVEKASEENRSSSKMLTKTQQKIMLSLGLLVLISVPIFKTYTHLPPFMGMLLGLSLLWIVTGLMRHANKTDEEHNPFSIVQALHRIDLASILFFLGILTAVAGLQVSGLLGHASQWLNEHIANQGIVVGLIGLLSSVVDNVPLVAAAQGMYSLSMFPMDHFIWELLAYAAGTGGSILIIGSAAGVAAMGMEKINFFWYLKKISWLALIGYFSGILIYYLQNILIAG